MSMAATFLIENSVILIIQSISSLFSNPFLSESHYSSWQVYLTRGESHNL